MRDTIVFDFTFSGDWLRAAFDSETDADAATRVCSELGILLDHVLAKFGMRSIGWSGESRLTAKIALLETIGISGPRMEVLKRVVAMRCAAREDRHRGFSSEGIAVLRELVDKLSGGRHRDTMRYKFGSVVVYPYCLMTPRRKFCALAFVALFALAALPHEVEAKLGAR